MLEPSDNGVTVTLPGPDDETTGSGLPLRIEVPREWQRDFNEKGPLPTIDDDRRRFQRFYCQMQAILHCRQTLPAVARSEQRLLVLTWNLSRGGVDFLCEMELFPGEQMSLELPGPRRMEIEIVRCRRHNDRCFELGACFVQAMTEDIAGGLPT